MEAGGAGELVDQRVAFGRQPGRALDVVMGVGLRQLVVELAQAGTVGGAGALVKDRVGAEGLHRLRRARDQVDRGHLLTGRGEEDGEVPQALRVP